MPTTPHRACFRLANTLLYLLIIVALRLTAADAEEPAVAETRVENAGFQSATVTPAHDRGCWIVSTHASPQSFRRSPPAFCPGVLRYERGQGTRPADFAELCRSLTPGIPVCINVHGSLVTWQDVCLQSQMTWHWLRSASSGNPVQLINLTWPSDRPVLSPTVVLDINLFGRRAARNGWYLAELIRHIPPECPICLVGHSHGARLIASAMHLMAGGIVQGVRHPISRAQDRRIRIVFAAAAIKHNWLNPGERYGRTLCSAECLINICNSQDLALHLHPLRHPFSGSALGTTGFTKGDRRDLGGWSRRVFDYDVARWLGHRHIWPNYYRQPHLAMLIRNYVYFPDMVSLRTESDVGSETCP